MNNLTFKKIISAFLALALSATLSVSLTSCDFAGDREKYVDGDKNNRSVEEINDDENDNNNAENDNSDLSDNDDDLNDNSGSIINQDKGLGAREFEEFLREQFKEMATRDSVTLNYTLRYPEDFGITRVEPTLGDFDFDKFVQKDNEVLSELEKYDYDALNSEQQLTYDIVKGYYELDLKFAENDMYYFYSALSPSSGIQAQLPTLLAEYRLYDEAGIEDYLTLLTKIDDYFKAIIDLESEKSNRGIFMADFTLEAVVKTCEDFLESGDTILVETFNSRMDELAFNSVINQEQKENFIAENEDRVANYVIPAYENLIAGLNSLEGTGINQGGLSNFENGKRYYELLVKTETGSDKKVDDLFNTFVLNLGEIIDEFAGLQQYYTEDVIAQLLEPDYGVYEPVEILEYLKSVIPEYYPPAANVNYEVKYVHPALEEGLAPAFYLIPPLDDYKNNVIYINNFYNKEGSLFDTLAHEGYPGHLYQVTYYSSLQPNPIRNAMNFSGYIEGWATYAQMHSFSLANFPQYKDIIGEFWALNSQYSLALQSAIDVGVNYYSWTEADTLEFLYNYGAYDEETARRVFEYAVQNPANTLKYYVGYLEFMELQDYAKSALGEKFSLSKFNESLLNVGPSPFAIVRRAVEEYVNNAA